MKQIAMLVAALALTIGLVAPASAADETLKGTVMCAKCTLKKADAKECQDVLVVKAATGATAEYYITKNAVAEKFGHVCTGETPATVTGRSPRRTARSGSRRRRWRRPASRADAGGRRRRRASVTLRRGVHATGRVAHACCPARGVSAKVPG